MRKSILAVFTAFMMFPFLVKGWTVPDETLHYSVNFRWGFIDANAGIATLTTRNLPDSNQFQATLTGKSINMLGHYYEVGDTLTGTIMADVVKPVYTEHISGEDGEFSIETITYDDSPGPNTEGSIVKRLPDGKVMRSRVSHYAGGLTLDLLSVFYYIRQIDYDRLVKGDEVTVNVFSGKNPETLKVTYMGRGSQSIDGTASDVFEIVLNFSTRSGGAGASDEMHVMISTDDRRIPLVIDGTLKVGHLVCKFIDAAPGS